RSGGYSAAMTLKKFSLSINVLKTSVHLWTLFLITQKMILRRLNMIENMLFLLILAPLAWMAILAFCYFTGINIKEKYLSESVKFFSLAMSLLAFTLFIMTLTRPSSALLLDYMDWISVGEYRFKTRFIVDV